MKAKITLDTRRCKKDGSFPIVVEVRNKDKIRVSTPYSAIPENWEGTQFNKNESNFKRKNIILQDLFNRAERFLLDLDEKQKRISDKEMRSELSSIISGREPDDNRGMRFIDCLDEFISNKEREGTRTVYTTTRNKIASFDPDCTFDTINKDWLMRFEQWMKDSGMKTNAYAIHLRNIRAVFNYAIDEEYTTLYPFRKFRIKKEETRKRNLTIAQLRILRDYPCEEYQVKYRDMFMLMFYLIGINAADLFLAKKQDVVNGRLEYKRAKTSKLYSIFIQPEARTIIDRYAGKSDYLLNVMDEYKNYKDFLHRMNKGLQQIGEVERKGLGGKKSRHPLFPELSSYWSRHTWATLAAGLDISKDTISEALGHEHGSSTTSIYINFDQRKVDEANRKVIDFVNGEDGGEKD